MNALQSFLEAEKEKAVKVYETAVIAEASGKKLKDPASVIDALATLNRTSKDFENAVQAEKEYFYLVSIAAEEESLRAAMHQAGETYATVVEECKAAVKEIEQRKKEASASYDAARRLFERANEASCKLAKLNSIQGRALAWKLQNILEEQKEVGRKLNQVRDSLRQYRIDDNSMQTEYNRTKDDSLHRRYQELQSRIKGLEIEESKLVKQSEAIQQRYEHTRLTRGVGEDDTSGGNQDSDL